MKKKRMGYGALLVGLIFLLSPDISIFDILPDFIGYLFIIYSLSRLADIDERAEDARNLSKKLFVLSCIKFVLSLYLSKLQKTNLLLVTFSLAILDVIIIVPFVKQLFHSIDYTATRQGVMLSPKKNSEAKTLLMFFFVLKDALMVAPTIVSLFDPAETGEFAYDTWSIDFSALTNVLTVLSFVLMSVLFVIMLVKVSVYFGALMRNRELCSRLYDNYEKTVLLVPARLISKNIRLSCALVASSFVFFADFYIDFIDMLPTVFGFGLVFVYALFARVKMKLGTIPLAVVSALGTVFGALSFYYRLYWQRKLGEAIEYSFSKNKYTLILGALGFVLSALTLVFVWIAASDTEKKYLGAAGKTKTVVLSIASAVLSLFGFILYSFPEKNATFVFPNLLFAAFFVYIAIDRVRTVTVDVLAKYKSRDF